LKSIEAAIKVDGLTKRYPSVLAVDRISFEVYRGEFFGFLGPNGAGKTTTINMLTGVTKATSGNASISGHDVAKESVKAKEHIGVVPDASSVYDEMTAWGNITFSAKLRSVPKEKRESRAKELLKIIGLYDRRNDRVGTFSRGMKKRLMVAVALVHEPEILFLDEPTSGVSIEDKLEVMDTLVKVLQESNVTTIFVEHDMEVVQRYGRRVLVFDEGRVIADGKPDNVLADPEVRNTLLGRV